MRRSALALSILALVFAAAAWPASERQRCDSRSPAAGSFSDCFTGHYHGTGFYPSFAESISFHIITPAKMHSSALWKLWVSDSKHYKWPAPCANANAISYAGTFDFYGGGAFIGCSASRPYQLAGYYQVRKPYPFGNDDTGMVLTHGQMSGSSAKDNVLELVFSDATHDHFAQPEVVLGASS
ncbi:MAG TPA: hypothetical protein VGL76_00360 [Gaiellaceae bacterium]|jgi:hypothetical protein